MFSEKIRQVHDGWFSELANFILLTVNALNKNFPKFKVPVMIGTRDIAVWSFEWKHKIFLVSDSRTWYYTAWPKYLEYTQEIDRWFISMEQENIFKMRFYGWNGKIWASQNRPRTILHFLNHYSSQPHHSTKVRISDIKNIKQNLGTMLGLVLMTA